MRTLIRSWIVCFVLGSLPFTFGACDDSTSAPSKPLNLNGFWAGFYGPPASPSALRFTWVPVQKPGQNGAFGAGTLMNPATNVQAAGTMTGNLAGSLLTIEWAPTSVAGFPRCRFSGTGTGIVTLSSISGILVLTFTDCEGSGLQAPDSNAFMLTRQN